MQYLLLFKIDLDLLYSTLISFLVYTKETDSCQTYSLLVSSMTTFEQVRNYLSHSNLHFGRHPVSPLDEVWVTTNILPKSNDFGVTRRSENETSIFPWTSLTENCSRRHSPGFVSKTTKPFCTLSLRRNVSVWKAKIESKREMWVRRYRDLNVSLTKVKSTFNFSFII